MAKLYKFNDDGSRVFNDDGSRAYEDDSAPAEQAPQQAAPETQFQRQLRITGKRLEPYSKSIDSLAQVHGISPELIKAIASIESTGSQTNLKTGQVMRSPAGALGMMQLMPGTAAEMKIDPMKADQNLAGGAGYLKKMLNTFGGDVEKGVAAYNAGAGTVKSLIRKYGDNWKDNLPDETKNYVVNAKQYYDAYGGKGEATPSQQMVSQEDLLGKRYYNPDNDPKIAKANLLFDDIKAQDKEVEGGQKKAFRSAPVGDRVLAGVGRFAYGLPGVGASYNALAGNKSSVADEDALYRRASKGDIASGAGEMAPDLAMLAAGGAGAAQLANKIGLTGIKALLASGGARGATSAGVHQGQRMARGQGFDPVGASLEVGLSALADPVGSKVGSYLKDKAPQVLQRAVSPTFDQMDLANPPNFAEVLNQKLVPYLGGTPKMEKQVAAKLAGQGVRRDAEAAAASVYPGTNTVRRAVNVHSGVIPAVKNDLDALMQSPKSNMIPEVYNEALGGLDYWKEQAKGLATQKGGWMSVEKAVGLRQAIDKQIKFRETNKTMTDGFQIASNMMRKKLNDYVRAVASPVAEQTDEMAKLQPMLKALERRNVKNPAFFTPFDYTNMLVGLGIGSTAPGAAKAAGPALAASTIGLRKLFSTPGGAAMLRDLGGSLGRSSLGRDATAQAIRFGINKARDRK